TGPEARTRVEVKETAEAAILDVQREEIRREQGPPRQRESYTLTAPATAPQAGAWELVLRTDRARFVRRVDITAEAPDGGTRRLVENGSLFRLPNIAKEKTRVTLPALAGARLTVTLEGEDGFFLEPRLLFESARFLDPREEASVPLRELARRAADGRTILELGRPRGLVPDVLRLETATPAFDLAGLLPASGQALAGERASAAARLRDPSAAVAARLGSVEANPLFDGAPALAFAMRPGAEVDTRLYSERRALGVRPSSEGLSLLRMRAEDVAHARPDLADVRVVRAAARQWPYLLEP